MHNIKKTKQLGMPLGTATHRLRKLVLFSLIKETKKDNCFRCGQPIEDSESLSIEHKEAWLDSENPLDKFLDVNNIVFSHIKCNIKCGRKPNQKYFTEEEKLEAQRKYKRDSMKRAYTTEKRQRKYASSGW